MVSSYLSQGLIQFDTSYYDYHYYCITIVNVITIITSITIIAIYFIIVDDEEDDDDDDDDDDINQGFDPAFLTEIRSRFLSGYVFVGS